MFLVSGRLSEDGELPHLAYSEQTCLSIDTFRHCTPLACISGNAQLGCLSVPTRTDAHVSLFVRRMASEGWLVQQGVLLYCPSNAIIGSRPMRCC